MRRLILIVLAALLLAIPASAQAVDVFELRLSNVNIRSGPGIDYPAIGLVIVGGTFDVLEYSSDGNWVRLDFGERDGWIFRPLGQVVTVYGVNTPVNVTTPRLDLDPEIPPSSPGPFTETGVDLSVTSDEATFNATVGVRATLNVRRGPGLNWRILTAIPYGQRATPLGRSQRGAWIMVDYKGTRGWVSRMFVLPPPTINLDALPITEGQLFP